MYLLMIITGNDEILMSVRFQDLESGINYFRYMWIHASAVPGEMLLKR